MASPEEIQKRRSIRRVKAAHEDSLLRKAGVTGVDINYKVKGGKKTDALSIVVYVRQKKDVPAKERIPEEIDGIPTDVVEEIIELHQSMVRVDELAPTVDTGTYTPLVGGVSIGPCRSFFLEPPEVEVAGNYVFVGTLGCVVTDNNTRQPMMLSNFHVMCVDDTWSVGDTMAQPSLVDTGNCPADVVGTLQRAALNQDVDAAVATIANRTHSCEIADIGDVKGTATPAEDMAVRKRGRTTELTYGSITSVDYSTNIDYRDGLGIVTLKNQIRIAVDATKSAAFGQKGDSGSAVVDDANKVVGLYFAGNQAGTVGVANPIQAVLTALDIGICTKAVKKIEWKEGKEFPKEGKEFLKDRFPDKLWFKTELKEVEVKAHLKDYVKDQKEWAYDKPDLSESKVFYEIDPWTHLPIDPLHPDVPIGQPPGFPRAERAGSVEERLSRLEATLLPQRAGPGWPWQPQRAGGCIDFASMRPGPGPNPLVLGSASFAVYDHTGAALPQSQIGAWGAYTGLVSGHRLEIKLGRGCPSIQATLVHFVQPATVEAWNADGSHAGSATATATEGQPDTVTISGRSITHVVISAPQNENLLLRLCCCNRLVCKHGNEEKLYLADHKTALKERTEVKGVFEHQPGNPGAPGTAEGFTQGQGSVEERLARLEAMLSGPGHFIPPQLRPDLSHGALMGEPDYGPPGMPCQG